MIGYPLDALHEEIAFLAYYLHWDRSTLLELDHRERRRYCDEVSKIHRATSPGAKRERSLLDL